MKKILLSLMMAFVSLGMWAQDPSVSFDVTKATIKYTGDDYCTIFSDESTAKGHFGEEVWNQIKGCTELVFVGKYNSSDQNNNNVFNAFNNGSTATKVDLSDATFGTRNGYVQGVGQTEITNMTFSPWKSTIQEAITSKNCTAVIPKGNDGPFNSCNQLKRVEFNSGKVGGILNNEGDCPLLESVVFKEGVTEILDEAFKNFLKVKDSNGNTIKPNLDMSTLVLPSTITKVGKEAFAACTAFEQIEMTPLQGSCQFGEKAFTECYSLKHVTLSEGVTNISDNMFDKCGELESIRIPTTCATIGKEAFTLCFTLHTIVIPEGVQTIGQSCFLNSGLTDIYVMATSAETVPAIYSVGNDGWGGNGGTFDIGAVTARGAGPWDHHSYEELANATDDEILTWYQEEQSDERYGVGGSNCTVQLHYPESMKSFYDGFETPKALQNATNWIRANERLQEPILTNKKNAIETSGYISEGYKVGGETDYKAWGPDKNGKYWPNATDYNVRILAGGPGNFGLTEPSPIAWRQLPIQTTSDNDDFIYEKQYDNTWYTMCFPWDMDDNQLFRAFNQKCEIAEFMGVEMVDATPEGSDEKKYNMVFHFDKVAETYYWNEDFRDPEVGKREYRRVSEGITVNGKNTTREEVIRDNTKKKYYTYQLIKGTDTDEYVYMPFDLKANSWENSEADRAMVKKYESITHFIAFAGHPYMIHPAIGANPGTKAACYFAGVKKLSFDDLTAANQFAEENAVTMDAGVGAKYNDGGAAAADPEKWTKWTNDITGAGGKYTFIGNITDGNKDLKQYDYFLGAGADQEGGDQSDVYPKYYRKQSDSEGRWSQYSAIIRPDADAIANIENYFESDASTSNSNVIFGQWEAVSPTEIEEIIAEAESKNQEVKKASLNVVFSVNGQVVRTDSTSVEGLPTGLYIVNGKKYMVK